MGCRAAALPAPQGIVHVASRLDPLLGASLGVGFQARSTPGFVRFGRDGPIQVRGWWFGGSAMWLLRIIGEILRISGISREQVAGA